jgi:predicted RNA-binding Zn-ribbon protein involved in translation (DUF1610 family)
MLGEQDRRMRMRKAKKKEDCTTPKGKAKPMLATFTITKDQLRALKRSLSGYVVHYMERTNSWLCDGCGSNVANRSGHAKDCPYALHEAAVNALPCPNCGGTGIHICQADVE